MKKAPFGVYYGASGSGKTHSVAQAFQNTLYIQSSVNILDGYRSWLVDTDEGKASGLREPKKVVTVDKVNFDESTGEMKRINTYDALEALRKAYTKKIFDDPKSYEGIVFDEWSTFWTRIFEELSAQQKGGNTFKIYSQIGEMHRDFCDNLRATLFMKGEAHSVSLVCHHTEPDPDKEKKGGPKMPSGTIMNQLCADADLVLYRNVELQDPYDPKSARIRFWETETHPNWIRKARTWAWQSKETDALRAMLKRARYLDE